MRKSTQACALQAFASERASVTALADALSALKNVVLMEERIDLIRNDIGRMAADMKGLNDYAVSIDKRLVRIETMIEMTTGRSAQPRLESN